MVESSELEAGLAQFIGSETHYRHFTGLHYTEGVKFLAENAGAYWLIDAIGSYRGNAAACDEPFQLWELAKGSDRSAQLIMRSDSSEPAIVRQEIPWTDFPLTTLKLYVVAGVLMLPTEY